MVKTESPAALALVTCKSEVRRGGKIEKCGKQYIKAQKVCPNRHSHLNKLKTGFCYNGWHEGSKAVDWRGNPVPTCEMFTTCPCDCHTQLGKLFEMTDSERILVSVSGYVADKGDFVMPDPSIVASRYNAEDDTPPVLVESPAPDRVPATLARSYAPTASGRAARGELESWVKRHCDVWLIEYDGQYEDNPCTPTYLANEIARAEGINPPSVGAISAVFDRWTKLGFAVTAKKPTRFVRYTDEGIELGLERMKDNAKRAKRLSMAEHRRNSVI